MAAGKSAIQMDLNLANELFMNGAFLVITGLPEGTDFGIDLCSYTIGKNFRGIKMIPPGPHFIWCASKGLYGDVAPRVGFVHFFERSEIIVREWDHEKEELCKRKIANPDAEIKSIRANIFELERYLGPYDYRFFELWQQLTDAITDEGIERCRPALETIRTNICLQSCPDSERPRGAAKAYVMNPKLAVQESDLLPDLKPIEGTAPRFTSLPKRVPQNSTPMQVTFHSLDCIEAINKIWTLFGNSTAIIEEIQISFLFYLVGYSVESLIQWRKFLNILSHSESAIVKYKLLYMKYSEALALQLPRLPEELMEPSENNTVYQDVRCLLTNLHSGGLNVHSERLLTQLQKTMDWEFKGLLDEDPDEMPVVVY